MTIVIIPGGLYEDCGQLNVRIRKWMLAHCWLNLVVPSSSLAGQRMISFCLDAMGAVVFVSGLELLLGVFAGRHTICQALFQTLFCLPSFIDLSPMLHLLPLVTEECGKLCKL